ncbi:MAG: hypothetical protein IPG33_02555, partial [Betaproteobacteria bacterium]|nr:hypothetical protein [Betaproteobacteria bacterium]
MARATGCGECRSTAAARGNVGRADHLDDGHLAGGQGAGLVEGDDIDVGRFLEEVGGGDDDAALQRGVDGGSGGERNGEAEGARAGDDQRGQARQRRLLDGPAADVEVGFLTRQASTSTTGTKARGRRSMRPCRPEPALCVPRGCARGYSAAFDVRPGLDLQVAFEKDAAAEHFSRRRRATPGRLAGEEDSSFGALARDDAAVDGNGFTLAHEKRGRRA